MFRSRQENIYITPSSSETVALLSPITVGAGGQAWVPKTYNVLDILPY